MKTHPSRRKDGFTLVELLVVIAIIAVLAAAGFAAGNAAIQKAKKVTSLATATAIQSAVDAYYNEYGAMPKDNMNDDTPSPLDTSKGDGITLLKVLLGAETTGTVLNTRGIKFLSVREGKSNKNGLIYDKGNPPSVTGLYDPWGGGYHVILDGNYDEMVKPAPPGGGGATLNGKRSAVWSNGADGVKGSGKPTDDVKTW